MARSKSLPTIWEVPDDLWERIEWLLNDYDPPKTTGRSRTDARKRLDGIIFRFRTGCQGCVAKITRDTKILNVTSAQATTSKRSATNLTCPRMSPFPIPSTCPFRIMFMASYPPMVRRAVLKLKKPSPGLTQRFMNR